MMINHAYLFNHTCLFFQPNYADTYLTKLIGGHVG